MYSILPLCIVYQSSEIFNLHCRCYSNQPSLSLSLSVFYLAQHKNRFYLEPYDTYSNCLNCIRTFKSVLALKSIMQQKFITKHYEQQYFLNELLFLKVNNNPKMWKLNNNSCINIGMLDFL